MKVAGIVLAGGKSSRFGKPKMFELYNGKPFYAHSIDALKAGGISQVAVATNAMLRHRFEREDVCYINDPSHGDYQGPLYALANAMDVLLHQNTEACMEAAGISAEADSYGGTSGLALTQKCDWFFLLASDIPYVHADFVKKMIANLAQAESDGAKVILPIQEKRRQPLFALYHRSCLGDMQEILAGGDRKIGILFSRVPTLKIPFSIEDKTFKNVNTEGDWQADDKEMNRSQRSCGHTGNC